jgi:alkylation response protein AidB-like acyl-CoA dehydrogenase
MVFEFNEEQRLIRDTAREFLKEECPSALVRSMREDELGFPKDLWEKMAEMGWMGVKIPEEYDGCGGDFVDLAIILEAMGEACVPGSFFATVVLGGEAILLAGSTEQKKNLLPRLAAGELILSFAQVEPGNWYGNSNINVRAEKRGNSFVLSGTKLFVDNAHIADYIICVARTGEVGSEEDGFTLFLVNAAAKGVKVKQGQSFGYEKLCEVVFDGVVLESDDVLGEVGKAQEVLTLLEQRAWVAKSSEMLGCIDRVLSMTVEHAKDRKQFGVPIGSFQAIQHHCADMAIDVESSRFITYKAAWLTGESLPVAKEAAMAKGWVSDVATNVTRLGHQIHGAVSFCDEHDMHLYYRKVKSASLSVGDTDYCFEAVAQLLWPQ